MDTVFHCTSKVRRSGKKSKHGVLKTCKTIRQVLRFNPKFGESIPGFQDLRKMRVNAPDLKAGKRGGYRLIYRAEEMDDMIFVVLLETYFKGDQEDLAKEQYKDLNSTAKKVLSSPMEYEWSEPCEEEDGEECPEGE